MFLFSDDQLRQIEKRMTMEIKWGLGRETNPNSNIKSYITYVSKLPSGNETGDFLALDLGGTNFRVLLISLNSKSTSVKIMSQKHQVRKTFRMFLRIFFSILPMERFPKKY